MKMLENHFFKELYLLGFFILIQSFMFYDVLFQFFFIVHMAYREILDYFFFT